MQRATLMRSGKQVLRIGIPLVVLAAIIYFVGKDWNQEWHDLTAHRFQLNLWLLGLAFVGFLLQVLSYGMIWRAVLARLGYRLDLRACLRIYLASEFVRYIPGNVWHVLTRILWVGKYGVSRPVAFASMTIELITKLAAGVLVFALSLLFWADISTLNTPLPARTLGIVLGLVCTLALLIGLHPRVLNGLLNFALRVLKRSPVALTMRYQDILLVTLAWCVSWLIAGSAFFVLLCALLPGAQLTLLPVCIGIYAIVWDIGFVSFITPSGLGVREAAVVTLFSLAFPSSVIPVSIAAIIAILSRFVSTVAEFLCVGIAYISGGRQVRALQQEQGAQPADAVMAETGSAADVDPPSEVSSLPVPLERGSGID